MKFNEFRKKINESLGILESFVYIKEDKKYQITITSDMRCSVNGSISGIQFESINEAKDYAIKQIQTTDLIENVSVISESKVAELIAKHDITERITDTHIKSYIDYFNSKEFTIDPVISEMKKYSGDISGKYDYILTDGSRVAISENTLQELSEMLQNKYEIVEFMRESKENFMQIIRNED